VVNCALFLIGTKSNTQAKQPMSDWNSDAGEVHKRLMRNHCPKCDTPLKVLERTSEKITRLCTVCKLSIVDNAESAEIPPDICD